MHLKSEILAGLHKELPIFAALGAGIYLCQIGLFTIPGHIALASLVSVLILWPVSCVVFSHVAWRTSVRTPFAFLAALPVALALVALIYYPQPCCAPAMRTAQLLQFALYKSRLDKAYAQEVAEHPNARYVLLSTDGGFSNEIGFAKSPFGDPSLEDTHGEHLSTYHLYGPYYSWSD